MRSKRTSRSVRTARTTTDPNPSAWGRELALTATLMAFEVVAASIAMSHLWRIVADRIHDRLFVLATVDGCFFFCIATLMSGSTVYLVTRLGYVFRLRKHRPAGRAEIERVYDLERPHSLAILVPSYREELRVVRQTLMSAALMEYPNRNIALLIDDPPNPTGRREARETAAMRQLPREIENLLRPQARKYANELRGFEERAAAGSIEAAAEARNIAKLYCAAAQWLENQAAAYATRDHYDQVFVERILLEPAEVHRSRAAEFDAQGCGLRSRDQIAREYKRLAALFAARLTSFERKRFVNLSHASNKAMNLNSYLGLLGRNFREVVGPGGLYLEECAAEIAQLKVPDAEYVITLDADSMLLGNYALRLGHIMDQPDAARYAVVQSPFTAVPFSPGQLERMAGAQTDVQWIASQGLTAFNASFWVGANALLRRAALEDICETVYERGFPIRRYIHDRTLVEDTESAIDLVVRGWRIYNYPDRLSYSATPGDFGALVIQRRRWANGPLLIVPKLLRYAFTPPGRARRIPEIILRLYGLTSISSSLAMAMMVTAPFPDKKPLPLLWLVLASIPYYLIYGRDLIACGYKWYDVGRMYSLNLLLIPVGIAGMLKSLRQAVTGHASPFTRTPKIPGRTSAPATYIVVPALWLPWIAAAGVFGYHRGGWAFAAFGLINVAAIIYALFVYIRPGPGWQDATSSISGRRDVRRTASEITAQSRHSAAGRG